jgi:hypothetical protein
MHNFGIPIHNLWDKKIRNLWVSSIIYGTASHDRETAGIGFDETESELLRLGGSLAAANEAKRQASRGFFANRRMVSRYEPCLHEPPTAAKSDCMLVSLIPTRF